MISIDVDVASHLPVFVLTCAVMHAGLLAYLLEQLFNRYQRQRDSMRIDVNLLQTRCEELMQLNLQLDGVMRRVRADTRRHSMSTGHLPICMHRYEHRNNNKDDDEHYEKKSL